MFFIQFFGVFFRWPPPRSGGGGEGERGRDAVDGVLYTYM